MKEPWPIRLAVRAVHRPAAPVVAAADLLDLARAVTPSAEFSARPIHFFPSISPSCISSDPRIESTESAACRSGGEFRSALFNSIVTSGRRYRALRRSCRCSRPTPSRLQFPGREVLFFAVVATLAVPGYAVLIPLYRLMVSLRQIDAYLGVTLIYVSAFLPLCLWLLHGVMDALPRSLEEAARIDGAGRMRILFSIIAPIAAPGLAAAAILTFLGAWGQYLVPLDLLAEGHEAAHGSDPRVRRQEFHRLWADHGGRLDRDCCSLSAGDFPQPLPRHRTSRRIDEVSDGEGPSPAEDLAARNPKAGGCLANQSPASHMSWTRTPH